MATETKRRGDIAAMYSSPGPVYSLPGLVGQKTHDPRSVHYKNPAWHFGLKGGKWSSECGPGPAYLPEPKLSRFGKDGTPQYSLYGRPKDGSLYCTPGPGAYNNEQTKNTYLHYPEYSFGSQHKKRRTDDVPGPNKYSVDPMLGKTVRSEKKSAPCITMGGKSRIGGFDEDLKKTPGPGNYNIVAPATYKNRCPAYSMSSRNPMPGDSTAKPGPGAHYPENSKTCQCAPGKTFGIRHSQYKGEMISDVDVEF